MFFLGARKNIVSRIRFPFQLTLSVFSSQILRYSILTILFNSIVVNCTSNCSIQLSTKCDQKSSRFEFEKDGIIRHVRTKECLYMGTRPGEKKTVSLSLTNCPNASRWEFLDLPTSGKTKIMQVLLFFQMICRHRLEVI